MKSTFETIGVSGHVQLNDCKGQNDPSSRTVSIAEWAQNKCKITGIVTTTKVTDASPSGVYARMFHSVSNILLSSIYLDRQNHFKSMKNVIVVVFNRYWKPQLGK